MRTKIAKALRYLASRVEPMKETQFGMADWQRLFGESVQRRANAPQTHVTPLPDYTPMWIVNPKDAEIHLSRNYTNNGHITLSVETGGTRNAVLDRLNRVRY